MDGKRKSSSLITQTKPWGTNENHIWLASTITLLRNVEKFKFPGKLNTNEQKQIIALIGKEFLSSKTLSKPYLVHAEDLEPLEKEYLVEHFLSSQSFQQAHKGEAFVLDQTGQFLMTINMHNHLQIGYLDCAGEIEESWRHLVKVETALGKLLTYAFSPKFGFLTSEPFHSGTGLLVTAFLQPSALIHLGQFEEVMTRIATDAVQITGLQGDPKELIGDIIAVRNSYTLGVTDENILTQLRTVTTKLMVEEKSARTQLKEEGHSEVKDLVARAYGILIHSYQIDAIEALDALSLLKLGADVGWVKGASPLVLNELFFQCRRAHLVAHCGKEVDAEELGHARAELIHKTLKKVTLSI